MQIVTQSTTLNYKKNQYSETRLINYDLLFNEDYHKTNIRPTKMDGPNDASESILSQLQITNLVSYPLQITHFPNLCTWQIYHQYCQLFFFFGIMILLIVLSLVGMSISFVKMGLSVETDFGARTGVKTHNQGRIRVRTNSNAP